MTKVVCGYTKNNKVTEPFFKLLKNGEPMKYPEGKCPLTYIKIGWKMVSAPYEVFDDSSDDISPPNIFEWWFQSP